MVVDAYVIEITDAVSETDDLDIVVSTTVTTTEVAVPAILEVSTPGPTGPQGPQGPQGPSGGTYLHTQSVPAATWTVTHSLGKYPAVVIIIAGDSEPSFADVTYPSNNVVSIQFPNAVAGIASV